jgi:hypothetical protein
LGEFGARSRRSAARRRVDGAAALASLFFVLPVKHC